ncbi:hypothetical protein [Leptolyngbya sp. Cla-17]|uniref:hypothetical protein n=1 Tax=Leptolyngbya sp. Cla-17 TaxID=2803751 RepID=UPI001F5D086B|nr:hypothetical protein [Leptolyngbya sp. Cla-17]
MPGLLIAGVSLLSAKDAFYFDNGRVGRVGRLVNQKYRCSTLTAVDRSQKFGSWRWRW